MNNSTPAYQYGKNEDISVLVTTVEILIFVLTLLGNIFVILTVYFVKRLRTTLNMLVVNLSIFDIMIVTFSIPFSIALQQNQDKGYIYGPFGCRILYPLATLASNGAVCTLLCITIERYIAIAHPMSWGNCRRHVSKVIALTYIYAFITVIPYGYSLEHRVSTHGSDCIEVWSETSSKAYTIALFLLQYGIPLPLMIICYTKAWIHLKRQNDHAIKMSEEQRMSRGMSLISDTQIKLLDERMRNGSYSNEMKHMCICKCIPKRKKHPKPVDAEMPFLADQRRRQTIRTFLMFVAVVCIFAICSLPNQITWLWISFFYESADKLSDLTTHLFYMLHYSNCVLNPWIYGGLNKAFRRGYKKVLCCGNSISSGSSSFMQDSLTNASPRNDLFRDGIITRSPVKFIHCGSVDSIFDIGSQDSIESIEEKEHVVKQSKRVKFKFSIGSFGSKNSSKLSLDREKRKISISLTVSRQRKLTLPAAVNNNYMSSKRKFSVPALAAFAVPSYEIDDSLAYLPPAKETVALNDAMMNEESGRKKSVFSKMTNSSRKRKVGTLLPYFNPIQEEMTIFGNINKPLIRNIPTCLVTDETNVTRKISNYSNDPVKRNDDHIQTEVDNDNDGRDDSNDSDGSSDNSNISDGSSDYKNNNQDRNINNITYGKNLEPYSSPNNTHLLILPIERNSTLAKERAMSEISYEPSTEETFTSNDNSSDEENGNELHEENGIYCHHISHTSLEDIEPMFTSETYNTLLYDGYSTACSNDEDILHDGYSQTCDYLEEFDYSQIKTSKESYI